MRMIYEWMIGIVYLVLLMTAWRHSRGENIIDALPIWDSVEMLAIVMFAAIGTLLMHVVWRVILGIAYVT